MTDKYTTEEQELIESLTPDKFEAKALEKAAELLVTKIGDLSFNAKLREDKAKAPKPKDSRNPTPEEKKAIEQFNHDKRTKKFLSSFTFKTRNMEQFEAITQKLDIATELQAQKLPISKNEKITLSEYNKISNLQSLNKEYEGLLKSIAQNSTNPEFKALHDNITKSSNVIKELQEKALLGAKDYKDGDIMMYLSSKTSALKGRQNLSGHEGKLEERFITKYNHAAAVYIDNKDTDKPIVKKSDVWREQRTDALNLEEMLESDAFRIDPTKLVDQKRAKQLETIDYGYKQNEAGNDLTDERGNKVKNTWQDAMHLRYEQLSNALHIGQLAYQIEEHETKVNTLSQEYNKSIELINQQKEKINELRAQKQDIANKYNILFDQLAISLGEERLKDALQNPRILPADSQEYKNAQMLKDLDVQYNSLAEKIQDKRDENKLLSKQLQEKNTSYQNLADLISKKQDLVIRNDRERLGADHWLRPKTILQGHTQWTSKNDFRELSKKMFGATPLVMDQVFSDLEKELQNPDKIDKIFQKELSQLQDLASGKTNKPTAKMVSLPKKLYSVLKDSKSEEDFKDKATKVTEKYLKAAKVEQSVIDEAKLNILPNQLTQAYQQKDLAPKDLFTKLQKDNLDVLEHCHNKTMGRKRVATILKYVDDCIKSSTLGRQDMICSEFTARSIVSVMDQLNKLTSIDLQASGIIDKEEHIINEPISKKENFTNLHPERLADILEKSGCTTRITNSYLKDLVQLENTDKSNTKSIDYTSELPKKLYSVLKDSKSEEDFKDKATKVTEIYLKAAKVEPAVIDKAKNEILEGQLDKIYHQHAKQPEGILEEIKHICIKVLEFCKLRTEDKTAKKNLDNMIKGISKSEAQENINTNQPILNKDKKIKLLAKSIGDSFRQSSPSQPVNSYNSKGSSKTRTSNTQQIPGR
jgi:hypothetical protein